MLSLRHGPGDTNIGAQFDQIEDDLEYLRIFDRNRAAKFLAPYHWSRSVLFVVDNSVGNTKVSELSWATSFPVLSEQPEILQAGSSHMSATAP